MIKSFEIFGSIGCLMIAFGLSCVICNPRSVWILIVHAVNQFSPCCPWNSYKYFSDETKVGKRSWKERKEEAMQLNYNKAPWYVGADGMSAISKGEKANLDALVAAQFFQGDMAPLRKQEFTSIDQLRIYEDK